jgi:1-acyl-sn-glycerol-3-phosphate acyltransferase
MSRVSTALDAVGSGGTDASWAIRVTRGPLRILLWLVMRLALRIRVEGERRPGPAVIASNHPNLLDGLLVLMADTTMRPIARWHRWFILRLGFWIGNCVLTSTGTAANPQRGAYAEALAHLGSGGRLWIAVEGRWQPERTLQPPRSGAVRLAHAASVPIQVLGIRHAVHPGPDVARWPWRRRPSVVLRWGPSITTTGHIPTDSDRLMTAIAETAGMAWTPIARAADPAGSSSSVEGGIRLAR